MNEIGKKEKCFKKERKMDKKVRKNGRRKIKQIKKMKKT